LKHAIVFVDEGGKVELYLPNGLNGSSQYCSGIFLLVCACGYRVMVLVRT